MIGEPTPESALHLPPPAPPRLRRWLAAAALVVAGAWWRPLPEPPPADATFDLLRDLPKATVTVRRDGRDQPCAWSATDQRFTCGSDYWMFVGPYAGTTAGHARRCVWVHPVAAGAPTVLQWPERPLGGDLTVALGLVDDAPPGAAVDVQVWSATQRVASLQSSDSRDLATVHAPLPSGLRHGPVRIEVRASDPTLRMACLELTLRGATGAAGRGR